LISNRIINDFEWLEFLQKCNNATFYQSPAWYKIWEKTLGDKYECVEYSLSNGNRFILPRQIRKRLYGTTIEYISGPVGTYGGFIGITKPTEKESRELVSILNSAKHLTVIQSPHFPLTNFKSTKQSDGRIINLDNIELNNVTSTWTKSGKSNYQLSKNIDYTFSKTFNTNILEKYFDVYRQSIERWGENASNNYPKLLFRNIFKEKNENIELLYLKNNGELVCGGIFFKFNNIVNWWHGAVAQKYISTGATYLFQEYAIKYYSQNFSIYDLGLSGGHQGVDDFKRRLGSNICKAQIFAKKPYIFKLFDK